MAKKRKLNGEVPSGNGGQCTWTHAIDDALVDAYYHEHVIGNRVGGTFTTHAFDIIVKELKGKFLDKPIDKERVQNRMKNIKKNFNKCYDIFKNGMSGFAFDLSTETWSAEPEVWEKLIEVKPEAVEWKEKPFRNYEKMVQLYGKDQASGQRSETALEMRRRMYESTANKTNKVSSPITIDEIDNMVTQEEIILENVETFNIIAENVPSSDARSQEQFHAINSTSNKKKISLGEEILILKKGIDNVAEAIKESTLEMVKATTLPISENELWIILQNLGLDVETQSTAYLFLVERPKMLRALLGCPNDSRKNLLMKMMNSSTT